MRKYKDRNYTGVSAGAYPWVPVDQHLDSFAVSYGVLHAGGAGQFSANIEGTYDNVFAARLSGAEASAKAHFVVTANPSTGLAQDGVITQPFAALRLVVGAASGASNVTFQLLQAGN